MKQLLIFIFCIGLFTSCQKEEAKPLSEVDQLALELTHNEHFQKMQDFRVSLFVNQLSYLDNLSKVDRENLQEYYKASKDRFLESLGYANLDSFNDAILNNYGSSLDKLKSDYPTKSNNVLIEALKKTRDSSVEILINKILQERNKILQPRASCWFVCMSAWNACDNGVWDQFDADWIGCNLDPCLFCCQITAINNANFNIEGCGITGQACLDECD